MTGRRPFLAVTAATLLVGMLGACASDPLAADYLDGGNENYISGSGITEIPESERGEPIEFSGTSDTGDEISRSDYDGEVLVVNFWYAGCAPCRAEAPRLQAVASEYASAGASFLGVNTYDSAETSLAFARKFDIGYPSIPDVEAGEIRYAFAGEIPPKAVPTTIVLDQRGRIAARILGELESESILGTIVGDLVKAGA